MSLPLYTHNELPDTLQLPVYSSNRCNSCIVEREPLVTPISGAEEHFTSIDISSDISDIIAGAFNHPNILFIIIFFMICIYMAVLYVLKKPHAAVKN